jgi:hypothetical protein
MANGSFDEIEFKQPITLKLVEDLPIRGRVIDLEGRPIAGTTVKIGAPQAADNEDLTAWIDGIKAGELPWTVYKKADRSVEPRLAGTPTAATTDAKGMFEIRGVGRERIVSLTFEGETVAIQRSVTRRGPIQRPSVPHRLVAPSRYLVPSSRSRPIRPA